MALVTSPLVQQVIGCAIRVHRALGPGLYESAYDSCLGIEFTRAGLRFERQVPLHLVYSGVEVPSAYRADMIVNDELLLEIKSVDRLLPIHTQQILTYLHIAKLRQGLIINFNAERVVDGIKSFLNKDFS
jgi:GxxExxY protein